MAKCIYGEDQRQRGHHLFPGYAIGVVGQPPLAPPVIAVVHPRLIYIDYILVILHQTQEYDCPLLPEQLVLIAVVIPADILYCSISHTHVLLHHLLYNTVLNLYLLFLFNLLSHLFRALNRIFPLLKILDCFYYQISYLLTIFGFNQHIP